MRRFVLILALLLWPILAAQAATIEVGVLIDYDKESEARFWDDFAHSVNRRLQNVEVRFIPMDRPELDDAVSRRAVDLLITDPAHRALLARRAGLGSSLLAVTSFDRGQPVVSAAGAIIRIQGQASEADLLRRRGLRVVADDRASLAGYQAQMLRLKELMPAAAFAAMAITFTGDGHASALDALRRGDADLALVPAGALEALRATGAGVYDDFAVAFQLHRPGYPYAVSTPLYPARGLYATPDADEVGVKAVMSVLLATMGIEQQTAYRRAYGFSLPQSEDAVRRVAFDLREPPYDSEPPISLQAIWRDYQGFVIALASVFAAFVLAFAFSVWLSLKFVVQKRSAVAGQRQLARLLETLPDIVYFKDSAGRYQLFNKKFAEFFGLDAARIIDKRDSDLFDESTIRLIAASDGRTLSGDAEQSFEETISSPVDGQLRVFLTTKTTVRDGDGSPLGILGVSRDITAIRRIEVALNTRVREQQTLNRLLKLTENIDRPIAEALPDLATMILDLLGSRETTRIELSWGGRVASDGAEAALTSVFDHEFRIAGFGVGTLKIFVAEISPETAGLSFASLNATLIDGITSHLHGFFERIAQEDRRAKAEVRLRKSEAIFRSLMDNTPLPVLLSTNFRFVAANPAAVKLLGYSDQEAIVGKTPLDLSPKVLSDGRIAADVALAISAIPEGGRAYQFEWEHLRADGTSIPLEVTLTPIVIDEVQYLHTVWTDISDRRRVERELDEQRRKLDRLVLERTEELAKARQEAEAASAAKSSFLANMSHEMRTPLNAIMGFAHLIRGESRFSRDVNRAEKIVSASEHLLSLINDILDSSKIEAGMLKLERQPFSAHETLRAVVDVLKERAEEKGLRLSLETDRSLDDLWVYGDDLRFRQILFNIIGNAVKFTEHGYVSVSSSARPVDADTMAIETKVSDSGVGIPSGSFERLFSPFEQAETSTSRRFGGSGLGLSISRRLARMMGGDVEVRSTVGRGSDFTIRIMCRRASEFRRPTASAPQQRLAVPAGTRVLVAEDNELNRDLAGEVLRSMGVEVITAVNGREAVEKALALAPQLVLMDMQMPELDGLSATREILGDPRGKTIPIVAMTANAFDEDRRRCMEAGMVDFVTKPLAPDVLGATVAKWTGPAVSSTSVVVGASPLDGIDPEFATGDLVVFDRSRIALDFVDGDSFIRVAKVFLADNDKFLDEFIRRVAAEDWNWIAKALHAKKPGFMALGARECASVLVRLEDAIRRGDAHAAKPDLAEQFLSAERRFAQALATHIGADETFSGGLQDVGRVDTGKFKQLLTSGDIRVKDMLSEVAVALRSRFGDDGFRKISAAVNAFDFPEALRLIDSLEAR